jgi:protein-L-isoaspartate(D-aspartate) O-methyltransferase
MSAKRTEARSAEGIPVNTYDVEQARYNMVEQQIRTWEVLDQHVLDLLFAVRREEFVPPQYRSIAFADLEIPLGNGTSMWTPKIEARVLQEMKLTRSDQVLEIGTGSGYFTALLASEAAGVRSVEIDNDLAAAAAAKLTRAGFANVRVETGDGARGWGSDHYDAIVLTGSSPILPERFFEQLKPAGRLFAILGDAPAMKARLVRLEAPGSRVESDLFETVVKPLFNAAQPARFEF